MATNSKVFVSPGVYTSERDLSFVSQSIGITTLGIVGETLKGPAFEPIFISNYDEFQNYFGGTSPEKFVNTQIPKYETAFIAKAYLQQSNQLFVTRILGLSGYDAGPSWSITTVANVDPYSVFWDVTCTQVPVTPPEGDPYCDFSCPPPTGTPFCIEFSGDVNSITISANTPIITSRLDSVYTRIDGSTSTLRDDIESQLLLIFGAQSLSATSIFYYGTIWEDEYATLSAYTDSYNVFGVDSPNSAVADFTSRDNDTWYYSLFNFSGGTNNCAYSGFSFYTKIDTLSVTTGTCSSNPAGTTTTTSIDPCAPFNPTPPTPVTTTTTQCTPDSFAGTLCGTLYNFKADCYSEYNNLVVATFRSRGISEFNSTNHGQVYEVSNIGNVNLDFTGSYAAALNNPFATFGVNVYSDCGDFFYFKASMQSSNTNYISKVFGQTNFGKPADEVPLFVDEKYDSLLNWAFNKGYIRGISPTLAKYDSARSGDDDTLGYYLERYQTPSSPWVVSELRGSIVYRLFKVVSVADGNSANSQIKISFANMSFENNRFDVLVRDYFDTDEAPVVLEKFTNCTMDQSQNNYIAKKIGTSSGDYTLNSKFIMLEMNEEAPFDSLPCGFEGYIHKVYQGFNSPFPVYKTRYTQPGEVIFNPPFGTSTGDEDETRSPGDVVRRTYLGISNNIEAGWDSDFFNYIGKRSTGTIASPATGDWNFWSKGFHMDSGATTILVPTGFTTSGQAMFECGAAQFRNDPDDQNNPYFRLFARKFTVFVKGGFDGWDIYREYRTNGDRYQLGKSGFLSGAAPSPRFPNATGEGIFKVITIEDNLVDWGNTDYYAYLYGQKTFNNPEAININVFTTPGIDYVNNTQLVKSAINLVELDRADSLYITTTPDYDMFAANGGDPTLFIQAIDAIDNLSSTDIDSNYTATYYPWILTKDSVNLSQIYIPPTAEVCRNLALTDNIAFPWFATAGYTRGLVNGVKARRKLTQEERDTLYIGRINPIATFADVGPVIWGNKTLQIRESALDRVNVRRLLLQARKLISAVAVRLLFEQNDEKVRQDFLDAVNPILDAIRRDRGLYDFRVTVSNDIEDLDKNQLIGKIYIKPTRALEFIDIEFIITPTGASFENV